MPRFSVAVLHGVILHPETSLLSKPIEGCQVIILIQNSAFNLTFVINVCMETMIFMGFSCAYCCWCLDSMKIWKLIHRVQTRVLTYYKNSNFQCKTKPSECRLRMQSKSQFGHSESTWPINPNEDKMDTRVETKEVIKI